jgi:hypothetical protein
VFKPKISSFAATGYCPFKKSGEGEIQNESGSGFSNGRDGAARLDSRTLDFYKCNTSFLCCADFASNTPCFFVYETNQCQVLFCSSFHLFKNQIQSTQQSGQVLK